MDQQSGSEDQSYDVVMTRAFENVFSAENIIKGAKPTTDCVQHLFIDNKLEYSEEDCYADQALTQAVEMIENCPGKMLWHLCASKPSTIIHSILSIFAKGLEQEAKAKSSYLKVIENHPEPQKTTERKRMQERQSFIAKSLIQRLWILLQAALLAGCPAISVQVSHFPCPPPASVCDLDLVWRSIKGIASAWMPVWSPEVHYMYHPSFKEAVKVFVLASTVRGIDISGKRTIFLNSTLVERIVQHMADNQEDWVPVADP